MTCLMINNSVQPLLKLTLPYLPANRLDRLSYLYLHFLPLWLGQPFFIFLFDVSVGMVVLFIFFQLVFVLSTIGSQLGKWFTGFMIVVIVEGKVEIAFCPPKGAWLLSWLGCDVDEPGIVVGPNTLPFLHFSISAPTLTYHDARNQRDAPRELREPTRSRACSMLDFC